MKYFTYNWWAGDYPAEAKAKADALACQYAPYLESILPDLPDELQRFARKCRLHDAHLLRLDLLPDTRELGLELVGHHYGDELAPEEKIPQHFLRWFRLTYRGIKSFTTTGNPDRGLPGSHGYGDLGYDEIEMVGPKFFEHRLLFSSNIEFQIRFNDFSFWYEDFETRRNA